MNPALINPFFLNKPESIIIGLGICRDGHWDNSPQSNSIFPCNMDIDYIRIYKKSNDAILNEINNDDILEKGNIFTGENISFSEPNCTFNQSDIVIAMANSEITFDTEVFFPHGSYLTANVNLPYQKNQFVTEDSEQNYEESYSVENSFLVFPNPNNGNFNIIPSTTIDAHYRIQIFNYLGKLVYESYNSSGFININLKCKGIYHFKLSTSVNSLTKQILVI